MKNSMLSLIFSVTLLAITLVVFSCGDNGVQPDSVIESKNSISNKLSDNPNNIIESIPEAVTINLNLTLTGPNTATGTFEISGITNDNGSVVQEFRIAGQGNSSTVHGHKILTGQDGEFEIRFQAKITPTSPTTSVAEGRFVILNGSGSYTGFRGQGTTYIELDFVTGSLTGVYEGQAHFDNGK
jgi:hypothetical protein